jgi:hypothetical protein
MTFDFVAPLLRLAGFAESLITVGLVAAGLVASLVLICGYFCIEMLHYNILSNRLAHDRAEWGRLTRWIVGWVLLALCAFTGVGFL